MADNVSINDLHDDCLAYIFKFLTLPEQWIAAQVCERWNEIDLYDPSYIGGYDISDPSWAYIFGPNTPEMDKMYIMDKILGKYGKYIKWLKYDNDVSKTASQYVYLIDLPHIMEYIGERLRTVKIFGQLREYELQSLVKCQKIIDFQCNWDFNNISNQMEQVFQNNRNLKYVGISVLFDERNVLSILKEKSIRELTIKLSSQDVTNKLETILADLRLTSLRIILNGRLDISNLMNCICSHGYLKKFSINSQAASRTPLPFSWFVRLTQLVELEIKNLAVIERDFYSQISSQLIHLKSLELSESHAVTDEDLGALAVLPKLEKLQIDGLRVLGKGLMGFRKLKYLSCKRSPIFDRFICHLLDTCKDLQFLNVTNCIHVTLATIDAAVEVIDRRTTNIPLRIILDFELAYYKQIDMPRLLELNFTRFHLTDRDTLMYSLSNRSLGVSCYFLNKVVQFIENIYSHQVDLPHVDDLEMCNILRFLFILDRVKMKRVSLRWNELIQKLWKDVSKLDLSAQEWQYLIANKTSDDRAIIITKILKLCGKYLKHIVVTGSTFRMDEMIILRCPSLETISNRGLAAFFFDVGLFVDHQQNLTKLSVFNGQGKDGILGTVFQNKQNLESLILFNLSNFLCFSLTKLNPDCIQLLHLYRLNLSPKHAIARINFCKAVYRLINLRDFKITPGYVHDKFIVIAMRNCKRLKALTIKHKADEVSNNLCLLFKFKELEKLAVRNSSGLNDHFLDTMSKLMGSISHLDITDCKKVTDDGLRAVSTLPNLQTLVIEGLPRVDGTGLSSLSGENFQHLECQLCNGMRSEPLCNVLRQCPNLMILNIAVCPRLDQSIIDTAIEVTDRRNNGIKLKMISDARLSRSKRGITSSLLEILIFERAENDMF